MKKLTKKEKEKAVDIMRKATTGSDDLKWELINILSAFKSNAKGLTNILSAFKSNAKGLTFPMVVDYIEKDFFNKKLKQLENEK